MKIGHIPSLDGLRAVAVALVFVAHAGLGNVVPGSLGVTVFFFLSGFLITTLLVKEYESKGFIHYRYFFLRRLFRLFPPLLVCLILVYGLSFLGLVGGGRSWNGLLAQLFYLANYHQVFEWPGAIPDGLGVLWSLAVEEHFYLFFPLTLAFLFRVIPRRRVPLVLLGLCAVVLAWRCYLVFVEHASEYRTYYATDTRVDSILFGCVLALTYNPVHLPAEAKMRPRDFVWLAGSVSLLLFSLLYRDEGFRDAIRYSVQGLALMPIFYFAVLRAGHPLFVWLNWAWVRKVGVYSYAIYLIHHVIIYALADRPGMDLLPVMMGVSLLLSLAFAAFVDRFVDRHFVRLRAMYR